VALLNTYSWNPREDTQTQVVGMAETNAVQKSDSYPQMSYLRSSNPHRGAANERDSVTRSREPYFARPLIVVIRFAIFLGALPGSFFLGLL
jgi:hypothetical protein